MTQQSETVKATAKRVIPVDQWTTVVIHDWTYPDDARYTDGEPQILTPYVDAQCYVNLGATMVTSRDCGRFDIRAVRLDQYLKGITDDTALDGIPVWRMGSGSEASGWRTQRWEGKNPAGLFWQLRPRSGSGILTAWVNTRQAKCQSR